MSSKNSIDMIKDWFRALQIIILQKTYAFE